MCKFTTIILLCTMFFVFGGQISAQNTDIELLRKINGVEATVGCSKFISNTTTEVAIGIPVVLCGLSLIEKDDNMLKNALYIGASMGVDGVLTYSLKKVINRPRPRETYAAGIIPYSPESSMSFPSGHTSLAFATATSLSLKYPKWYIVAPTYLWACSVGYSRMNLGVHYPSDVLAGAVLGAGSAFVTYKVNEWFWKKQEHKKLIGLCPYL